MTFASESLAPSMDGWREVFSTSDHQYIALEVAEATCRLHQPGSLLRVKFVGAFGTDRVALEGSSGGSSFAVDSVVNSMMKLIKLASEA